MKIQPFFVQFDDILARMSPKFIYFFCEYVN